MSNCVYKSVDMMNTGDFVRKESCMKEYINSDNGKVSIAENGQKAVELFKTKIYDAALFDVQMPVMDGIAATQEIREIERKEKRKRLPIIAVTARAMFGDKERILENQLDDYIAKPYNLNDVVDTLNKYIDD